jgi:AcrR family transcriptional regulator
MNESRVIWERPQPVRRVQLDRDQLVTAATALADREGLAAVTLRRVAADLGVLPMRLYTHLETKDDLLDLMLDAVYATVEVPGPEIPWREALTAIALCLRSAAEHHPWLPELLGTRPPYGPHGLRLVERVWTAVRTPECASAYIGYVTGSMQQEIGAQAGGYLARTVTEATFPALARAFAEVPQGDTFRPGLDVVLDGIALRLRRRPAR